MAVLAAIVAGVAIGGVVFGIFLGLTGVYIFNVYWDRRQVLLDPSVERRWDFSRQLQWLSRDTSAQISYGARVQSLHGTVTTYVGQYLECLDTQIKHDSCPLLASLAGSGEDWHKFNDLDAERRQSFLIHFICRVLHQRMVPDGDLNTPLLPVDMLSTYRRMLTKCPEWFLATWNDGDRQSFERRKLIVRQHWRAITTCWMSERFQHLDDYALERKNYMRIDWTDQAAANRWELLDDDPRMPHIIATEQVLRQALAPLFHGRSHFQSNEPRDLRWIVTEAADLAIKAFSDPNPTEFYWPQSNRRDGCDAYGNAGMLECFGVRTCTPMPGLGQDPPSPESVAGNWLVLCTSFHNDTWDFGLGSKSQLAIEKQWYQTIRDSNGEPSQTAKDQFVEDMRRTREYQEATKREIEQHPKEWQVGTWW